MRGISTCENVVYIYIYKNMSMYIYECSMCFLIPKHSIALLVRYSQQHVLLLAEPATKAGHLLATWKPLGAVVWRFQDFQGFFALGDGQDVRIYLYALHFVLYF